ncbi:hypothetical protein PRZ48_015232 [Zasmidium cellare]|uniref:F-box domain-containing protein n=1 Tax=Zasmidium cellare TaxID=395010 RepID=A0ABR0DY29_ZASCE|nr:hypothetical protein PRZ48_015232 [Zasmidium cellare]
MAKKPTKAIKTAARKVFSLPELVENIANHLPNEDLFVVQRVSSTFHTIVTEIEKLQESMYRTTLGQKHARHCHSDRLGTTKCACFTLKSPALKKAMEPLLLRYLKTSEWGDVVITGEFTPTPYFCRSNAGESWRQIKLDHGDSPLTVRGERDAPFELWLPARVTLGEVYDQFLEVRWKRIQERFGTSRKDDGIVQVGEKGEYEYDAYYDYEESFTYRG